MTETIPPQVRNYLAEIGSRGGKARVEKQSDKDRSDSSSHASKEKWKGISKAERSKIMKRVRRAGKAAKAKRG